MAYQQQGGGVGGGPEGHGPQGTEYTLQGVMRFLQIEWHSHERARNAWDIERAEMKAKIAKQEGECKQAKRLNEQLDRQVRMLEMVLKNERAKAKGGKVEEGKDGKKENGVGKAAKPPANVPHNSFLETDEQPPVNSEKEHDQYLDNTTKYLKNCMKEIQYLLTPPQNPPPPQVLPNGNYTGLPDAPLSDQEFYARQQEQQRRARGPGQQLPQPTAMPNHQPPPVPNSLPQPSNPQDPMNARGVRYQDYTDASQPPSESVQQTSTTMQPQFEEPVESVTHTFDSRGRPMSEQDQQQQRGGVQLRQPAATDGWTFDDEPQPPLDQPPPSAPPPRRPDTDLFPSAAAPTHLAASKSPPRSGPGSHRRKSSGAASMSRRRSSQGKSAQESAYDASDPSASDPSAFKVKFALRGHLDVVRSVIFSGGGSPSEPEVCSAGDDGTIKRWIIPASYQNYPTPSSSASSGVGDLDVQALFTHRGHEGIVTSLAACSAGFNTGGRANGDGWIFSGGQDATVRVWERGRVDPKETLVGHSDAVWAVCVLPATCGSVFGAAQASAFGGADRLLLVSGSADGCVKVWAVSAPPPTASNAATGSRRGVGGSRRHSVTSGSNFPSSPQPSVASNTPFAYTLVHSIERPGAAEGTKASPTSIAPLSPTGETFVVAYTDSSVLIFDTRTGEEVLGMASNETYDGTMATSINAVVATSLGLEGGGAGSGERGLEPEESVAGGATGGREGVEGVVISGHEDRFVRFFDANSGQCTYTMLAHPSPISSLSLSHDGREAVSAGHDASIRFWSLEKRICTQDLVCHRVMRGEGVCDVCWSSDGRLVVSCGGDGVVKVFAR